MSGPLDFDDRPAPRARPRRHGHDHDPPAGPPEPPRYAWVIGIGALVLVAALGIGLLQQGSGRGARGLAAGSTMPPFAAPLVLGSLDGDVNLARRAGEGQAGAVPACSVRGPQVLNGCALWEAGPVVLAFFTPDERCVRQLDVLQRARRDGVRVAAIAIRGDRDRLRRIVRDHRWTFPVGWDRDGALANAYHVQVCPQMTFARRGGRVWETTFGSLDAAAVTTRLRDLTA